MKNQRRQMELQKEEEKAVEDNLLVEDVARCTITMVDSIAHPEEVTDRDTIYLFWLKTKFFLSLTAAWILQIQGNFINFPFFSS